ncbi:MAG: DUF202 domain-containing protein [Labilithrix sp.]|nr:DUF202 domain-containing protein [Labilithrix sp.]
MDDEAKAKAYGGWERTWLALERTLLAWVRTSASLITFGFAFYKFVALYRHEQMLEHPRALSGAHVYELIMIGLGVTSLMVAMLQHRSQVRHWAPPGAPVPRSVAAWLAALFACAGILAFAVVWLRA